MLKRFKLAVVTLALLAMATGLTWTALSSLADVDAPSDIKIHVNDIRVLNRDRIGRGERFYDAWVFVEDEFGNPVSDAVVTGDFSGCFALTGATAITDAPPPDSYMGRAVVEGKKVDCKRQSTCTLTFTVTGIVKEGFHYDPSANLKQSDSITLCR
jgi:hypothetical protein